MQVSVRPPDTSAVSPHRQCGGDWDFWLESALEFLASADGRLQEPLEGESFGKMAHSLKTGGLGAEDASPRICLSHTQ